MKVAIDLIEPGQRLRPADPAQVAALAASIRDVGLLNPITVYPRQLYRSGNQDEGFGLVAGLHRLRAMQQLGAAEIEATVVTLSDLERQIAEVDENLAGPRLSTAERARFTKRRKQAYEALHGRGHGSNQGEGGKFEPSRQLGDTERFTADTAKATGASERTVQRDAERGDLVMDDVLDLIRGTPLDTGAYLDKIKKLPPGADQFRAAERDLAWERKKAREEKRAKLSQIERQTLALRQAWDRAGDEARMAFKKDIGLMAIVRPTKSLAPSSRAGKPH